MPLLAQVPQSRQFISNAFDPNCYLPEVGKPDEIDSVNGTVEGTDFGAEIRNVGSPYGHASIVVKGLQDSIPFLSSIESGPNFDVHNINIRQKLKIDDDAIIRYGHFRNTRNNDLLSHNGGRIVIYWADDSGYYDMNRITVFSSPKSGDVGYQIVSDPCTANFTSDTVEDILYSVTTSWVEYSRDSSFLLYYKGGEQLFQKGAVPQPDSVYDLQLYGLKSFRRNFISGDWRGTGRRDVIAINESNNATYYSTSTPFSMSEFYRAVQYDAFFVAETDTNIIGLPGFANAVSMRALPKSPGDKSLDLIFSIPMNDKRNKSIWIFRGHSEFGKNRLTLDSAAYRIPSPEYYDPSAFSGMQLHWLASCGDMTGTGNNTLLSVGSVDNSHAGLFFFYVLGKALDDKVDAYFLTEGRSGLGVDTLTANGDNLQDVLVGLPGFNGVGALQVMYGSKKIPVHLNSVNEDKYRNQLSTVSLYAYPNPLDQKTTLTFENCTSGVMYMEVVSSIGVSVMREEIPDVDGLQQYAADLSALPAGAYHIRLVCPADGWSAGTNVIKTGAAVKPWSLELKKMVGR